jgi:hypothetical protein
MKENGLFELDSPVASRQPKTDRLILPLLLKNASMDKRLDQAALKHAHQILIKWADLESSGRFRKLNETQMQGDFLTQVFGDAPGYSGATRSYSTSVRKANQSTGRVRPVAPRYSHQCHEPL